MKTCYLCEESKPITSFSANAKSKDGLQHYCKPCQLLRHAKWREDRPGRMAENAYKWRMKNPDKAKESNRQTSLKKRYGISIGQYEELLNLQSGCCAICNEPEKMIDKRTMRPRRLAVDHNNVSGKVRGLLCKACNTSIGGLNHSIELLEKAIKYLK